jgi:hypothetical protein
MNLQWAIRICTLQNSENLGQHLLRGYENDFSEKGKPRRFNRRPQCYPDYLDVSHIEIFKDRNCFYSIPYDSDKDLLEQSEDTKFAIIELITNHS